MGCCDRLWVVNILQTLAGFDRDAAVTAGLNMTAGRGHLLAKHVACLQTAYWSYGMHKPCVYIVVDTDAWLHVVYGPKHSSCCPDASEVYSCVRLVSLIWQAHTG
jgi:hypothetical protein